MSESQFEQVMDPLKIPSEKPMTTPGTPLSADLLALADVCDPPPQQFDGMGMVIPRHAGKNLAEAVRAFVADDWCECGQRRRASIHHGGKAHHAFRSAAGLELASLRQQIAETVAWLMEQGEDSVEQLDLESSDEYRGGWDSAVKEVLARLLPLAGSATPPQEQP